MWEERQKRSSMKRDTLKLEVLGQVQKANTTERSLSSTLAAWQYTEGRTS